MRIPGITATGWTALALCLLSAGSGWWLGWTELMIISAALAAALLLGLLWVVEPLRYELDRSLTPDRVTVGDAAIATLLVRNPTKRPLLGQTAIDKIGNDENPIQIQALRPGETREFSVRLLPSRRGKLDVGPIRIERGDPLGFFRRQRTYGDAIELWVHPQRHRIPGLSMGLAKDLDGPTSDSSPQGGLAFHAIRPFQIGDEFRHIHWPSTAKTGWPSGAGAQLMVRHFVDNRRPHLTLIFDEGVATYRNWQSYELAVEIGASLIQTVSLERHAASAFSTIDRAPVRTSGSASRSVLDWFTESEIRPAPALVPTLRRAISSEPSTTVAVLLTGRIQVPQMQQVARFVPTNIDFRIVRVGVDEPGLAKVSRANIIDVNSSADFVHSWSVLEGHA